jgi:hypothetical protein
MTALNTIQPGYINGLQIPSWASRDKISVTFEDGSPLPQTLSNVPVEDQRKGFVFNVFLNTHNVKVKCDWEGGSIVSVVVCDAEPSDKDVCLFESPYSLKTYHLSLSLSRWFLPSS